MHAPGKLCTGHQFVCAVSVAIGSGLKLTKQAVPGAGASTEGAGGEASW